MNKLKQTFEKVKSIKHIHIYLAVFVGLLACLAYFTLFSGGKNDKTPENSTKTLSSAEEYVEFLENKLENVLSQISGAGQVDVIVTLESGFTYEYAKNIETRTSTSGSNDTSITTETVITVGGEPVVEKEIFPVIKGVVVIAKGAADFAVKMKILSAVETVLEVDRENITVLV